MSSVNLQALLTGAVAPLTGALPGAGGSRTVPSGIAKRPVSAPLPLGVTGFSGDGQGDTRHHGGPEKAVHHYPLDHYDGWRADLGAHPLLTAAGAFGENLSTLGLDEAVVAVGDVFRLGTAVVQVSQGRQPCFRLNLRFGRPDMARRVQASGRTGWYYRVLHPGVVGPDDTLTLIDRVAPAWTLARLWRTLYADPLHRGELQRMAALTPLAEGWRLLAARRLASGTVEDWGRRLDGPAAE